MSEQIACNANLEPIVAQLSRQLTKQVFCEENTAILSEFLKVDALAMRLALRNQNEAHFDGYLNKIFVVGNCKTFYNKDNNTPQASLLVRRDEAQIGGLIFFRPWV